ncbi:MAG: alpha/beta hydrolase [Candidatus Marinimicrobia bacterium]|nr:alpha/beta hydrolase [Candidatus Neomarinimicrobiota bacterium]MCF7851299.1 alpha/beta hydrolase [Candidatus Neomarinimicrobiota bacterium]MCF7904767.1 alpha/beta hydrolase [Candidatus Neomarinimicrobiota bacterium]
MSTSKYIIKAAGQASSISGVMDIRKRVWKRLLAVFALLVLATLVLFVWKQPRTPPIRDAHGQVVPGSISSLEQVELGGVAQWVLIRGTSPEKPILVFLHGGPGMPMMYLAHAFQRPLEDEFLVVQWDRRGAGKSFDASRRSENMRVSQLLSDTRELIGILKQRYQQEKVLLVSHSFGSYLGMLYASRYPDDLHAFIGIGQVVDSDSASLIQADFIRNEARKRERPEAIAEIDSLGSPAFESWLFAFGGELYNSTSWWPLLWTGFKAPEYGLKDVANVPKGSSFSSRHMAYDVLQSSLLHGVQKVAVPVYFFTGRHDYTTPHKLVKAYSEVLEAPIKEIVWFENSAHFPFFEEPRAFAKEILAVGDATVASGQN